MTNAFDRLAEHPFAAALSHRVTNRPHRVIVMGRPVVLFRDPSGAIAALEDRCPHRGVALSGGVVSPSGLTCPYHGWSFSRSGLCTAMPGAPGGAPLAEVRVAAFETLERDGVVWLSTRSAAKLPERVDAMVDGHRRFLWQTRWPASMLDAQENFLDALHTHSVHPGLVRGGDLRRSVAATLRCRGDGFSIDYEGQAEQSGWLFRLFESRRTLERAYCSGLSVAQIEYRYESGWAAWITLRFTPETDTSTHVIATLHVEGRWAPAWLIRATVWPLLKRVNDQDSRILRAVSKGRDDFPQRLPVVTRLDIVRPYLEAAWEGDLGRLPAERRIDLEL